MMNQWRHQDELSAALLGSQGVADSLNDEERADVLYQSMRNICRSIFLRMREAMGTALTACVL